MNKFKGAIISIFLGGILSSQALDDRYHSYTEILSLIDSLSTIEEYQSIGNNYIDWYRIEIFNGIKGWIYHTQLSRKRTLLVLEDTELFALNSNEPDSWLTILKGEILAPKTIDLLEVTPEMLKVSISISDRKEIKGWIPRDDRVWGDDPKEIQQDFD